MKTILCVFCNVITSFFLLFSCSLNESTTSGIISDTKKGNVIAMIDTFGFNRIEDIFDSNYHEDFARYKFQIFDVFSNGKSNKHIIMNDFELSLQKYSASTLVLYFHQNNGYFYFNKLKSKMYFSSNSTLKDGKQWAVIYLLDSNFKPVGAYKNIGNCIVIEKYIYLFDGIKVYSMKSNEDLALLKVPFLNLNFKTIEKDFKISQKQNLWQLKKYKLDSIYNRMPMWADEAANAPWE